MVVTYLSASGATNSTVHAAAPVCPGGTEPRPLGDTLTG
jgi:hypothetical protein